eukprot:3742068-Ditylum_brightwellii.AAC.1
MPKGSIYDIYIKRKAATGKAVDTLRTDKYKSIHAKVAHSLLGHMSKVDTKASIKYLGYKIRRGNMNPCDAREESKAKQK